MPLCIMSINNGVMAKDGDMVSTYYIEFEYSTTRISVRTSDNGSTVVYT
jgi:hypothetical protein